MGHSIAPIAGCFGYVVIEEGEDWWDVVDELGAPANAVSISCDRTGTCFCSTCTPTYPGLIMTYKELLQQLQQLSEEQLNQDVCYL
jgi:hypothetical protein